MLHKITRKVISIDTEDNIVLGIDPSLEGTAIAKIENGSIGEVLGWTSKSRLQSNYPSMLSYFKLPPHAGLSERQYRIEVVLDWVIQCIDKASKDLASGQGLFVAIEGYAFSKRSVRSSDIQELCGGIKQHLWDSSIPFRIYDPKTVKMAWATGNAEKSDMIEACSLLFGKDFSPLGEGAGSNLADALLIAQLLWEEIKLKTGKGCIHDLSTNLKKIMCRVTKASPVPLTELPFIHKRTLEPLRSRKKGKLIFPIYGGDTS